MKRIFSFDYKRKKFRKRKLKHSKESTLIFEAIRCKIRRVSKCKFQENANFNIFFLKKVFLIKQYCIQTNIPTVFWTVCFLNKEREREK